MYEHSAAAHVSSAREADKKEKKEQSGAAEVDRDALAVDQEMDDEERALAGIVYV
jgi:hypothetical protein